MSSTISRSSCCLPYVFARLLHFRGHNQTESHAVRIAILPTWTMDVIYIRALTPTFSWGKPHNGDLSITWLANKTLSYVLPRATLESCSSLRLRASSRVHSQCTQPSSFITGSVQSWLRPVITHPRQAKITQYEIVWPQNWFSLLWYPNRVYGEDFFRKVFHCTKPLRGGLRESSAVCIFVGFCSSHTVVDFTFWVFFTMKLPIPLFFIS